MTWISFSPTCSWPGRGWHVAAGQVLVGAVLELSSITALVMSAVTKGFINAEHEAEPGVVSTAPAHAPSGHFNSQIAFWP